MKSKDQFLLEAAYQQISGMNEEQHRVLNIFKSKAIKIIEVGPRAFQIVFPDSIMFDVNFVGEDKLVLGFMGSGLDGQLQTTFPSLSGFTEEQFDILMSMAGPHPKAAAKLKG